MKISARYVLIGLEGVNYTDPVPIAKTIVHPVGPIGSYVYRVVYTYHNGNVFYAAYSPEVSDDLGYAIFLDNYEQILLDNQCDYYPLDISQQTRLH